MSASAASHVFVHEEGVCESTDVGSGTRVWAFAHVMSGARVGRGCNVGDHAFIESGAVVGDGVTIKNGVQLWDGVVIEDDVFLGPAVVFTNDRTPRAFAPDFDRVETRVARGASIGANASVVCGVTIGRYAMVGAGSVVCHDVAPYALVLGNPARAVGFVCHCGQRLPVSLACACGRAYREASDAEGPPGLEPV